MPATKIKSKSSVRWSMRHKAAASSQESENEMGQENIRGGGRLRAKARPDFSALSGKKTRSKAKKPLSTILENSCDSHDDNHDEHGSTAEEHHSKLRDSFSSQNSELSERSSQASSSGNETDESMQGSQQDEQELEGKQLEAEKLRQIEQQTRARIVNYQAWLKEQQKRDDAKARRRSTRKVMQSVEEENEKRLRVIAQLQREEDELAERIKLRKSSRDCPWAQSTPKKSSEYDDIIRNILNMSYAESDFVTQGDNSKKLAPQKIRELRSLLENSNVAPLGKGLNNNTGACFVGRVKKRKEHEISASEEGEVSEDSEPSVKKSNLKSGKCAKVDNTDIKKVVRYPHSKLNREFVSVVEFDQLPLNLFAAGETELILCTKGEAKRDARLRILLMCLYHSQFLDVKEIREQYDVIMKGIERGEWFWVDNLTDKLDRALDRRARVLDRQVARSRSVEVRQIPRGGVSKKNDKVKPEAKEGFREEVIYCMDFNKGRCPESGSHVGRFAGRDNVFKLHICQRCWMEKSLKVGHPEIDDRCPQFKT